MNEITAEQKDVLTQAYRAISDYFECVEETPDGLRIVGRNWQTMRYFPTWQALAVHLEKRLQEWHAATCAMLDSIIAGEAVE